MSSWTTGGVSSLGVISADGPAALSAGRRRETIGRIPDDPTMAHALPEYRTHRPGRLRSSRSTQWCISFGRCPWRHRHPSNDDELGFGDVHGEQLVRSVPPCCNRDADGRYRDALRVRSTIEIVEWIGAACAALRLFGRRFYQTIACRWSSFCPANPLRHWQTMGWSRFGASGRAKVRARC